MVWPVSATLRRAGVRRMVRCSSAMSERVRLAAPVACSRKRLTGPKKCTISPFLRTSTTAAPKCRSSTRWFSSASRRGSSRMPPTGRGSLLRNSLWAGLTGNSSRSGAPVLRRKTRCSLETVSKRLSRPLSASERPMNR